MSTRSCHHLFNNSLLIFTVITSYTLFLRTLQKTLNFWNANAPFRENFKTEECSLCEYFQRHRNKTFFISLSFWKLFIFLFVVCLCMFQIYFSSKHDFVNKLQDIEKFKLCLGFKTQLSTRNIFDYSWNRIIRLFINNFQFMLQVIQVICEESTSRINVSNTM